jgi:hypothetical protein
MRKQSLILAAAVFALSAPVWALAAMDHSGMSMDHTSMKGSAAHEEMVDGVKATFKITTIKEAMKEMKMEMPKGMKETHHISVEFVDAKSGKPVTEGQVKVKVMGPDKAEQTKDLMGMHGHFGGDFDLSKKGKYGVMSKFMLKDGKTRSAKFWYTVK